MSEISNLLMKKAEHYRAEADELAKASADVYKALELSGADMVKAASLLINNDLSSDHDKASYLADLLEKVAEYVVGLEGQVEELQSNVEAAVQHVDDVEKQASFSSEIQTLQNAGFDADQIAQMLERPDTLEKVASLASVPFSMGEPVGMSSKDVDPLLSFCMN